MNPPHIPVSADIIGVGLCSAAGDDPFSVLCALGGEISATRPWDGKALHTKPKPDAPLELYAPLDGFPPVASGGYRMKTMAQESFKKLAHSSSADNTMTRLVVLLVPQQEDGQTQEFSPQDLIKKLLSEHFPSKKTTIRIISSPPNHLALLHDLMLELSLGMYDEIILGGVDSLANYDVLKNIYSSPSHASESYIPGEGAAFVRLAPPGASLSPLARITLPDFDWIREAPRDLKDFWVPFFNVTGAPESDIDCLLPLRYENSAGGDLAFPFSRGCAAKEELSILGTLGDVGAAILPLALSVAATRFAFEHPPVSNVVLYESRTHNDRIAAVLQRPMHLQVDGNTIELSEAPQRRPGSRLDRRHPR